MLQNDVLDTVIGPSATWRGTLRSDGGVRVEGRFEGCIEVAGNVVVAESGIVDGNIVARDVVIGGVVRGDVEGAGRLEVLSTGQLIGDITVSSFMIDEGGLFEGISRLQGAASARALALPAPMKDVLELPDVVIDVEPKRGRKRKAASSADPTPDQSAEAPSAAEAAVTSGTANVTAKVAVKAAETVIEPTSVAVEAADDAPANGTSDAVAAADVNVDVEKTTDRTQASVEVIDPERIAKPKSAGASGKANGSIFDDLNLDIEPIIPDASSKSGSARMPAKSATNGDESSGQSSNGAAPSKRSSSKRGPSKSALRRAASSKNGRRS